MPHKPYCTDNLANGLMVRSLSEALTQDYIQFNPPTIVQALVFDIDREDAFEAATDANVAQPSLIIKSKNNNGHAHFVYILKTPIAIHEHSNMSPIRYAAAIERGYAARLGADRGYVGLVTKNPLTHDTIDFNRTFELHELDAWLDFEDKAPNYKKQESRGLGRNVDMFDMCRFEAYDKVQGFESFDSFHEWCFEKCNKINENFSNPLPFSEPKTTAKSIAKWTWKNQAATPTHGKKNRGAMAMVLHQDLDLKQRQVAAANYTNKLQTGRTKAAIQSAYFLLVDLGKKPTQKRIAERCGISLKTVKRYWKKIEKKK